MTWQVLQNNFTFSNKALQFHKNTSNLNTGKTSFTLAEKYIKGAKQEFKAPNICTPY